MLKAAVAAGPKPKKGKAKAKPKARRGNRDGWMVCIYIYILVNDSRVLESGI